MPLLPAPDGPGGSAVAAPVAGPGRAAIPAAGCFSFHSSGIRENPSGVSVRCTNPTLEIPMKNLSALFVTTLVAGAAVAGPTCTVPQEKWIKEADFKARLEAQGYQIKTFKVSRGQCYEIYGFDKNGRKVEIYFDPQTGAVIESR